MAGKRILWLFLFCVVALIAVYVGEDVADQSQRNKLDGMAVAENAEAQAKFDLQHHNAKLYIYGLVIEDQMKTIYKNYKVQLVYRGCMIGGADFEREMRYNRVVKTALGLPLDEFDLLRAGSGYK
jgi:hypothetical protein